jgi:hypothetical protein
MARIAVLFGSEANATHALDALAQAGYDNDNNRVFYGPTETLINPGAIMAATPHTVGGPHGQAVVPLDLGGEWDLAEDEVEFFSRAVSNGGVLALLDVDNTDAGAVHQILRQHNGRVSTQS